MAWFEISNDIERRFYQEALSPDLKWRKQGLASFGRCCLIENAISPPNCEVFKPASKSGYPNIWCVDIFKTIWESSSSFLSWLRFMKVGKVEKNVHTFLLSSSLIHHLIGPWKWGFEGFRPWAASKNRLKHLIPILSGGVCSQNPYDISLKHGTWNTKIWVWNAGMRTREEWNFQRIISYQLFIQSFKVGIHKKSQNPLVLMNSREVFRIEVVKCPAGSPISVEIRR